MHALHLNARHRQRHAGLGLLDRRDHAGLDTRPHRLIHLVEQGAVALGQRDRLLARQHVEERRRHPRQHIDAGRFEVPLREIAVETGQGASRRPLPAELDQLTQLQRCLRSDGATFVGRAAGAEVLEQQVGHRVRGPASLEGRRLTSANFPGKACELGALSKRQGQRITQRHLTRWVLERAAGRDRTVSGRLTHNQTGAERTRHHRLGSRRHSRDGDQQGHDAPHMHRTQTTRQ